jgi:hypothetical protein
MARKATDPTVGDLLTYRGEEVVIGGRKRRIRRLGIRDMLALLDLWNNVIMLGDMRVSARLPELKSRSDLERLLWTVLAGAPACAEEAEKLLSDWLGVTREEFADPNQFPMETLPVVINALLDHRDVAAFFSQVGNLMPRLAMITAILLKTRETIQSQTESLGPSTSSAPATDTPDSPTKTS